MSSSKAPEPHFEETPKLKLKPPPALLPPSDPSCTSDELHPSAIPNGADTRKFYLNHVQLSNEDDADPAVIVPPPLLSASPFVPPALISHLMREKKDSALGIKYVKGDSITNSEWQSFLKTIMSSTRPRPGSPHMMNFHAVLCSIFMYRSLQETVEGALHTFIATVIPRCEIVGDYAYTHGHSIVGFGSAPKTNPKVRLTRSVALSASIQPDFETPHIMLHVSALSATKIIGSDFLASSPSEEPWSILTPLAKQDPRRRASYDERLRAHMIYHLTSSHYLPARCSISSPLTVEEAISFLKSLITSDSTTHISDQLVNKFTETDNHAIISLELLYNTSIQQILNEFSALEALFPQGYVYTYDPASIFAREIGAEILNRLFLLALKSVSAYNPFTNMRTFAVNDYADEDLVELARYALASQTSLPGSKGSGSESAIRCISKTELFTGKGGLYSPTNHEKGAMLVLHNNSDGFGQNIETEGMGGSLDGTIGASSSAAASLERNRTDLLDFIF